MESTKFGPCECSPTEEDWSLVRTPKHSRDVAIYECATCDAVYRLEP